MGVMMLYGFIAKGLTKHVAWLATTVVVVSGCAGGCGGNAREQYLCTLQQKVDRIVELMTDPTGRQKFDAVYLMNGRGGEGVEEVWTVSLIGPAARSLTDTIEMLPMALALEIRTEDDSWRSDFSDALAEHRARIRSAAARLSEYVREPESLRGNTETNYYERANELDLYLATQSFGFEHDRLYVDYQNERYYLQSLLDFDDSVWLDSIAAYAVNAGRPTN
jgi:hypothetical protein